MGSVEDDKVRIRLAEIMSSAGVGYNQISLEILYLLPREFVDRYIDMWTRALGPGIKAPGEAMARDSELGRANTDTSKKGLMVGAGSGGVSKRYKKIFVIADERALMLKDRIDKRLRGMAREIRRELGELEERGRLEEKARKSGEKLGNWMSKCGKCGKLGSAEWAYCPYDGSSLTPKIDRDR